MAIASQIDWFLSLIAARKEYLKHNCDLLEIFEGSLFKFIDKALRIQLSNQSYDIARTRIPPINVLRRIIDKQSKIYSQGVSRIVVNGDESDSGLMSFYDTSMETSTKMQTANAYFNLFKGSLLQPYLSVRRDIAKPSLRILPGDRFIAYSTDKNEDEKPTGFVLMIGKGKNSKGKPCQIYQAIDDNEFVYFNSDKENVTAQYAPDNPGGANIFGRVPFVYINRDPNNIMPTQDSDTMAMSVLIPLLLTDINFAHMFQAFSILYGINVKDNGLVFAPNAFWNFETAVGDERKPEIGQITPQANIDGGLNLVANQFALWLNTKGIKPGAVGEISATNFASGVAKMMDEMDTSEDRNAQIPYFQDAETELFDLVLNYMHPVWEPDLSMKGTFSPGASVVANFSEQVPLIRRGQVIADLKAEKEAGFTTTRLCLKRLNPHMSDNEITELEEAIDEEKNQVKDNVSDNQNLNSQEDDQQ